MYTLYAYIGGRMQPAHVFCSLPCFISWHRGQNLTHGEWTSAGMRIRGEDGVLHLIDGFLNSIRVELE